MATRIVDGVIVRTKVPVIEENPTRTNAAAFSGRSRSFVSKSIPVVNMREPVASVREPEAHYSSPPRPTIHYPAPSYPCADPSFSIEMPSSSKTFSVENPPPKRIRSPLIEETVVSEADEMTIKYPYENFEMPCLKFTSRSAVIFFPKDEDPAFSFTEENFVKRMEYMRKEFNVFGRRVDTLEEAIRELGIVTSQYFVEHLELGGHGSPTTILWPMQRIEVGESDYDLTMLFSMLVVGSSIVTLSCKNGKNMKEKENMLEYLARIGFGHRVIGTKCDNGPGLRLEVTCPYPIELKYTNSKGEDVTVIHQLQ